MVILTNPDKSLAPAELKSWDFVSNFEEIAHNPEYAGGDAEGMHWVSGTEMGAGKYVPLMGGLTELLFRAYSKHYWVELTPDQVWAAIATQLAFYVNARAEELRERLVSHKGQMELEVTMPGTVHTCRYDKFVEELIPLIDEQLKDDLAEWFMPKFSTTTPNVRAVLGVTLMATTQKYFTFTCNLRCGIKGVKLHGEVADWEALCGMIQKLRTLATDDGAMDAWVKMLEPIGEQLLQTARGVDNFKWWQEVVHKTGGGSGPTYVEGWAAAFTTFTTKGAARPAGPTGYPKVDTNHFAPGIVSVPVKIVDDRVYHATMFSGCLAARVGSVGGELSLAPVLSWSLGIPKAQLAESPPAAGAGASAADATADDFNYRGGRH